MRIGVLTGGGDCPGLNAVIRAVVRKGVGTYEHEFVGFRDGWKGPLEGFSKPLGVADVRGILPRGGTILGSSRTNPFKIDGGVDKIKANLAELGIDALVAIGGEDTLGVATKLDELGVKVVGVPKTIDNDLGATDYTFGFDTAVNIAMEAIDRLHTTAESHHRTLVVEVMGRHAGWIALHAGLAGGANVILLPEREFDVEQVAAYVDKRFQHAVRPDRRRRRGRPADRRPDAVCMIRSSTRSGTYVSAASVSGSPSSSRRRPARKRARWCSGTSSAAARRPPSTACSRPGSACTRSTPCTRATSARWSRCAPPTSCACRWSRRRGNSRPSRSSATPRPRCSSAEVLRGGAGPRLRPAPPRIELTGTSNRR